MQTKAEVRSVYGRIADSFARTRARPWPEVLDFLDGLPARSRILDVGCGNGRHLKALVARGHHGIGVDFSRELLTIGREGIPPADVRWIEADATRLPLRDRSVDAALCIAVLHHLPTREDRMATLSEIARVLLEGGRVLISVWDRDHPRFLGLPLDPRGDVDIPWTLPDGTKLGRYYHLFRADEFQETIIGSGLHGERFFCIAGNRFALAINHG